MAATVDLSKVAMVFGIIVCLLVIATGIVGAVRSPPNSPVQFANTVDDPNTSTTNRNSFWSVFIISVILIVFGIFGVLCEIGLRPLRRALGFFNSYWTRAVFYIMLGILTFGVAGDLGITATIVCGIEVIFLIILGFVADPPRLDTAA